LPHKALNKTEEKRAGKCKKKGKGKVRPKGKKKTLVWSFAAEPGPPGEKKYAHGYLYIGATGRNANGRKVRTKIETEGGDRPATKAVEVRKRAGVGVLLNGRGIVRGGNGEE